MKIPSIWFVAWIVTTQCVNLAFYLAVTRVACGWLKSIGAYLVGYLMPLAACMIWLDPHLHGGARGANGSLAIGFTVFFVVWGAVVLTMSRGVGGLGLRLFSVLVCGVHQLGAFSFSLTLMHRVKSESVGALLGCAVMAAMGALLVLKTLPRVRELENGAGWRDLNLTAAMNFILLYTTGIWPTYVPTGSLEDIVKFLVANAVAIAYFPVALAFAERQRTASALAIVERSMKLMTKEMAVRRSAIDDARRQRHDRRHHRIVMAEYLLRGQTDQALAYLEQLDGEADQSAAAKFVWCENDTINAILSGYARKAESKGVKLEVSAHVGRTVDLPDVDVVAIVANLLENAINAAGSGTAGRWKVKGEREQRNVSNSSVQPPASDLQPVVRIALRQRERTLGMTVANPVPADFALSEKGLPCAEPGIGLEGVQRVIERYRGELVYTLRDGMLECQAMMRVEDRG